MSYGRFHNLPTDMQIRWRHKFRRFRQSFDNRPYFGEPLLVPFYTSLNADISETRKDITKWSTIFFPVFPVLSCQDNKNFHFISTLKSAAEWDRKMTLKLGSKKDPQEGQKMFHYNFISFLSLWYRIKLFIRIKIIVSWVDLIRYDDKIR